MNIFLDEIVQAIKGLLILFGFIAGGVVVVGLFLCIFIGLGLRSKLGVYDPLYKCWFDYSDLNEEQENRQIPGSDRLAKPPKGTKRQPPFWKEQRILRKKIFFFITMGNKPKPRWAFKQEGMDAPEKMPEPYKSFAEFENYISELKWNKIEDEHVLVSMSGLYLFNCHGDNHTSYEAHELEKGDKLCKHYLDHHPDGWAVVKPLGYHYVEDDKKDFVKEWVNKL